MEVAIAWSQPEQLGPVPDKWLAWFASWQRHMDAFGMTKAASSLRLDALSLGSGSDDGGRSSTPGSVGRASPPRPGSHDGCSSERRANIALHGGTPWVRGARCYRGIIGLHHEIVDFYNWMRPDNAEYCVRQRVFEAIRGVIKQQWPESIVDCFGSFRTMLFLPTSDIDVVVVGEWGALPLQTLADALVANGIADGASIKVLAKASVPIIKLTTKQTDIRVDISFNMNFGVRSVHLINEFLNRFPTLRYLVFLLKQFLVQRDLNEVFTGGVSSYSLLLMIVSFLQLHPTADVTAEPSADGLNLGVLLLEFLELYGRDFNYVKTGIRIKAGGSYVPKEQLQSEMDGGHRPSMLCIEDPLQAGNDIGRSSFGAIYVKEAFHYAFVVLGTAVLNLYDTSEIADTRSLLGRIVRITDEAIEYRNMLKALALPTEAVSYASVVAKTPSECSSTSHRVHSATAKAHRAVHSPDEAHADSSSDTDSDASNQTDSSRASLTSSPSRRSYSSVASSAVGAPADAPQSNAAATSPPASSPAARQRRPADAAAADEAGASQACSSNDVRRSGAPDAAYRHRQPRWNGAAAHGGRVYSNQPPVYYPPNSYVSDAALRRPSRGGYAAGASWRHQQPCSPSSAAHPPPQQQRPTRVYSRTQQRKPSFRQRVNGNPYN